MQQDDDKLPFECMCVAIERAKQVSGADDGPWTVGVRDEEGALLASAMLDNHAQVKAFTTAMEDFGFVHTQLPQQETPGCCDFSFRRRVGEAMPA
ncbi:MAG TPA: hypothetical protein VEB23_12770 [Ramlibacter sp.]|nr:hypothetical protein [Ramlibacter sp.]